MCGGFVGVCGGGGGVAVYTFDMLWFLLDCQRCASICMASGHKSVSK